MSWNLEEAIIYYRSQGAPRDQTALINLLMEVQQESGGAIPPAALQIIGEKCGVKSSFLAAVIGRMPRLRMADTHVLEVCAGSVCGKSAGLAAYAESLRERGITVKFVPCMRQCGKGPNIKWDGKLYHQADEERLRQLAEKA